MIGKMCLVTGATSGIGAATAMGLAQQGATVIAVGRNLEKCEATVSQIKEQTKNPNIHYIQADLSSQEQIRSLAQTYLSQFGKLHVLVNNAGATFGKRMTTVDGIEMTFALNHLAYFLLTNLLLDSLKSGAPSRIINVSSFVQKLGRINFDDLQRCRRFIGWQAYNQSKLANLIFTYELARRLEGSGVTVNALNPGLVSTNFGQRGGGIVSFFMPLVNLFSINAEEASRTSIYLATSPEVEGVTGKYFEKCKAVRSSRASYDVASARRLWQVSAELTGLPASI